MSRASKKTILSSKTPRDLFRGTGLLTPQTNTPTADSDEPFMNEAPLDWGTSGINLNGGAGSFSDTLDVRYKYGTSQYGPAQDGTQSMGFQPPGWGQAATFEFVASGNDIGRRFWVSYPNTSQAQGGLDKTTTYAASGKARLIQVDIMPDPLDANKRWQLDGGLNGMLPLNPADPNDVRSSNVSFVEFDLEAFAADTAIGLDADNNPHGIQFRRSTASNFAGTSMFLMMQGRNPRWPYLANGGTRIYEISLGSQYAADNDKRNNIDKYTRSPEYQKPVIANVSPELDAIWNFNTRAICSWAFQENGTHVILCGTDITGTMLRQQLGGGQAWNFSSAGGANVWGPTQYRENIFSGLSGGVNFTWDPNVDLDGTQIYSMWWSGGYGIDDMFGGVVTPGEYDGIHLYVLTDFGKLYQFSASTPYDVDTITPQYMTQYPAFNDNSNFDTSNLAGGKFFFAYENRTTNTSVPGDGSIYFYGPMDKIDISGNPQRQHTGNYITRYSVTETAQDGLVVNVPTYAVPDNTVQYADISWNLEDKSSTTLNSSTYEDIVDITIAPENEKKFYVYCQNPYLGGMIFKYDVLNSLKKNPLMGGTINWEDTLPIQALCSPGDRSQAGFELSEIRSLNVKPDGTTFIVGARKPSSPYEIYLKQFTPKDSQFNSNPWEFKFVPSVFPLNNASPAFTATSPVELYNAAGPQGGGNCTLIRISPDGTLVSNNYLSSDGGAVFGNLGTTEMTSGWDVTSLVTNNGSVSKASSGVIGGDNVQLLFSDGGSVSYSGRIITFYFNKDGTTLIVGTKSKTSSTPTTSHLEYALATPYDIRTATFSTSFSLQRSVASLEYYDVLNSRSTLNYPWLSEPTVCFLSHDRNYVYSVNTPYTFSTSFGARLRNVMTSIQSSSLSTYYTGVRTILGNTTYSSFGLNSADSSGFYDKDGLHQISTHSAIKWASNGLYAYSHDREYIYRYKTDTPWDLSDLRRDQTLSKDGQDISGNVFDYTSDKLTTELLPSKSMGIDISRDGRSIYFQSWYTRAADGNGQANVFIRFAKLKLVSEYSLTSVFAHSAKTVDALSGGYGFDWINSYANSPYGINGLQVSDDEKDFFMLNTIGKKISSITTLSHTDPLYQPSIRKYHTDTAGDISSFTMTEQPLWSQTSGSNNQGVGQGLVTSFHFTPGGHYLILQQDALGALITYQCPTPWEIPTAVNYLGTATYGNPGGYGAIEVDPTGTKYFLSHSNTTVGVVKNSGSGSTTLALFPDGGVMGGAITLFKADVGYNFSGGE